MTKYQWYLNLSQGILAIAIVSGCQNTDQKKELVQIKDIDYYPETKTTLVTVGHRSGCTNQNYQYEYQELDSNTADKNLTYGLYVDLKGSCQKKDLQFIRLPLPQLSFLPDQLIFQSSDHKKVIFTAPSSEIKEISQIRLEPRHSITVTEDVSLSQTDQSITLDVFIPEGCDENYTHKYKIIEQNSVERSASLALITEVVHKCDRGDYQKITMPLPKLPFQPDKLIFPVAEAKQIMLTVTPRQN